MMQNAQCANHSISEFSFFSLDFSNFDFWQDFTEFVGRELNSLPPLKNLFVSIKQVLDDNLFQRFPFKEKTEYSSTSNDNHYTNH